MFIIIIITGIFITLNLCLANGIAVIQRALLKPSLLSPQIATYNMSFDFINSKFRLIISISEFGD